MKKYYFLGGIFFLALAIFVYIIGFLCYVLFGSYSLVEILTWPGFILIDYLHKFFPTNLDFLMYSFSAVIYFIVGAFLGGIYGQAYKKKINKVISNY